MTSEIYVEDYINKVMMLERLVGHQTKYNILEPFDVDTNDQISVQYAAKRIRDFLNLESITCVISYARQDKGVGGHIDLNDENTVYIEITPDVRKSQYLTLAILSHELTHKYMKINGISSGRDPLKTFENEILTDITGVFLGLGKLLLNGTTYDNRMKVGYLQSNQLAFVYLLVCSMRGIPEKEYAWGVVAESLTYINRYKSDFFFLFQDALQPAVGELDTFKALKEATYDIHKVLSHTNKCIEFLQHSVLNYSRYIMDNLHKKIQISLSEVSDLFDNEYYDPCLTYLNNCCIQLSIKKSAQNINTLASEALQLQSMISDIVGDLAAIRHEFPALTSKLLSIIKCPVCAKQLQLPENMKSVYVTCPSCGYQFIHNTEAFAIDQSGRTKKPKVKRVIAKLK